MKYEIKSFDQIHGSITFHYYKSPALALNKPSHIYLYGSLHSLQENEFILIQIPIAKRRTRHKGMDDSSVA